MKRKLLSILQLALGVGLIALLFFRMDNKADLLNAVHDIALHWGFLSLALLSFGICISACAIRWHMILKAHDIPITPARTVKFYFIGQFFNAFMPGAVGGDLIKAVYVAREFPDKRTISVTTIFIDRLIGILSLLLLVDVVILLRLRFFLRYPETRIMILTIAVASAAILIGLILIFRRNILARPAVALFLKRHYRIGSIILKVYTAFQDCLTHRGLMTRTTIVSLVNHVAMIFAAFFIGLGLNIRTTTPEANKNPRLANNPAPLVISSFAKEAENYLTLFPLIDGIAAIPVTPGGLGTREYTTQLLLGLPEFNVPPTRAVPLSLLLYLTTMFWSLVGGGVYAVHVIRGGPHIPVRELKQDAEILKP